MEYALAAYYVICTSEASSNLARFDGVRYGPAADTRKSWHAAYQDARRERFGSEVRRRIMLGTFALSSGYYGKYYAKAQVARENIRKDFARLFADVDVLCGPTMPTIAFKLGEKSDPLSMYLSDILTVPVNLAGIPAISVPCGKAEGMPVGLQIMGRHFEDERVIDVAYAYEQVVKPDWTTDVIVGLEVHCQSRYEEQTLLRLRRPITGTTGQTLTSVRSASGSREHMPVLEQAGDRVRDEGGKIGQLHRDRRRVRVLRERTTSTPISTRPTRSRSNDKPPGSWRLRRDRRRRWEGAEDPAHPHPCRGGPGPARAYGKRRARPVLARGLQPCGYPPHRDRVGTRHALAKRGAQILKQVCGPRSNTSAYSIQKKKDRSGSMLTSRSGAASAWRSKNITSYKGVEKALTFEVTRQKNLIRGGLKVERETRHYLEARGITQSARSKEMENDYRYFPEPDLRPLRVQSWVKEIVLPELPDARRERFVQQYGCSLNHARTLTGELRMANFFEAVVTGDEKNLCALAATWIADTLAGELNYRRHGDRRSGLQEFHRPARPPEGGTITDKSGVEVLRVMLDQRLRSEPPSPGGDRCPAQPCEDLPVTMRHSLQHHSRSRSTENPKAVEDYSGRKRTGP